jgi:hypothetical protein
MLVVGPTQTPVESIIVVEPTTTEPATTLTPLEVTKVDVADDEPLKTVIRLDCVVDENLTDPPGSFKTFNCK